MSAHAANKHADDRYGPTAVMDPDESHGRGGRGPDGPDGGEPPPRRLRGFGRSLSKGRRLLAAALMALALLLPLGVAVSLAWTQSSDAVATADTERAGVDYLRPLGALIGALDAAQASAVRGTRPDSAAVDRAVAKMNDVDADHGGELGVGRRWIDLRMRVELLRNAGTGRAAYDRYSEVLDLTLNFAGRVGDNAKLLLDPRRDSYFLADAALVQLPTVMVQVGRHADLLALTTGAGAQPGGLSKELFSAATAEDAFDAASDAVDQDLRATIDATDVHSIGDTIASPMDAFRGVADAFPRPFDAENIQLGAAVATAAEAAAGHIREAAQRLYDAVLDGLDDLVADRASGDSGRRAAVGLALVLGVLAAAGALWALLPGRAPAPAARTDEERMDATELAESLRADAGARRSAETSEALEEIRALLGARELLRSGELVRVGRAVRPGGREYGGDSE